jgi:hypothetical protein
MKTAPWQRMRTWKGGWVEGVCTDLRLECSSTGYGALYEGDDHPCRISTDGCKHAQVTLLKDATRKRPTLGVRPARRADGTCIPEGERGVGGEENSMHPPARSPIPGLPKQVTVDWFLANGWQGSTVEERLGAFTLTHPSGAVLRLKPGAAERA